MRNGESEPNLGDGYNHFDSSGKIIGSSQPNFVGGITHYDKNGCKTGESQPNFWGGYTNYDKDGKKIGETNPSFFTGYSHYDNDGNKLGETNPKLLSGYKHTSSSSRDSSKNGCYIATCVYGSYDCPPVWTLRRYRDEVLRRSASGRAFIRCYYAVSPAAVKLFGNTRLFKTLWKRLLDKIVKKLNDVGFDGSRYSY